MNGHDYEEKLLKLMQLFDDREVPGNLFHSESPVWLPSFSSIQKGWISPPDIEVDLVASTPDGSIWVVETKCRNRRAGVVELKKLERNSTAVRHVVQQRWFVSSDGFTIEAISYGHQQGLLLSADRDIAQLEQLLCESSREGIKTI